MTLTASIEYSDETLDSIKKYVQRFGTSDKFTIGSGKIPPDPDYHVGLEDLDLTQGAIIDLANVTGIYFDWEQYDPPNIDLVDELSAQPVNAVNLEDNDIPTIDYITKKGRSRITKEYIEKVNDMWDLDLVEDPGHIEMFPENNGPIQVPSSHVNDETFILIAPRIIRDE